MSSSSLSAMMDTTAGSSAVPAACRTVLLDLRECVETAQQTWIVAKAATGRALAEERAALEAFGTARSRFDDTSSALSRVYGAYGMLSCPRPPSSASASNITSDILSEIFKHAMEPYDYDEYGDTIIDHPAFIVAAVCKHWRATAFATPAIWTKVRLSFTADMWTYVKAYLEVCLARSGGLPLDLFVCSNDNGTTWSPVADQIVTHVLSRCRTVRIMMSNDQLPFRPSILPRLHVEMPELRAVRFIDVSLEQLDESVDADDSDIPPGTCLLALAPNLESLDMATVPCHFIDPEALPSISSFKIFAPVSVGQLGCMARAWHQLRHLDIGDVKGETPLVHDGVPFAILESLKIASGAHSLLRLVSHGDMPALRVLSLSCNNDVQHGFFSNFLQPGPCASLRSLTLSGRYARMFPNTFALLSALETLCVCELESKAARDFFGLWNSSILLAQPPKLARLRLENCAFSLAAAGLFELLRHRPVTAKLRALDVVQNMLYRDADDIFAPWMAARARQLVENVTIDTAKAVRMFSKANP